MKVQTVQDLSEFLRDDLAWRRKELRVLDGQVKTSAGATQQAILRGAIAALYAHWEGFVKAASAAYTDFVRMRGLQINELQINFVGMILRPRLRHLATSGRASDFNDLVSWLLREWKSRAYLPKTEKLSTQSNLSPDVFRDLVNGLGLDYRTEYQVAEKTVIEPLLASRNHLAHGEWERIEQDVFEQYLMSIDQLLVIFCDSVEEAAASGNYRRAISELV